MQFTYMYVHHSMLSFIQLSTVLCTWPIQIDVIMPMYCFLRLHWILQRATEHAQARALCQTMPTMSLMQFGLLPWL